MADLQEIINKRRTFAIISHPDAGKTTLTEKLLLYGGAIHLAGSVKARKAQKHAVSDWMEIEKQRGISVTSSVLQFDYEGFRINILDTPGHQDFSEDTYRTLMAADSAVMLIDVAKGVEEQTKKLFYVCRQRGIPVFTFVNKLDRYGKSPFDLMEELEQVLGIRAYPMNWPVGTEGQYIGVYNRALAQIELFDEDGQHGQKILASKVHDIHDESFRELLGDEVYNSLKDDIELLDMAGDQFDLEKVREGQLTPMFFGSAMTNFGVRPFLEEFLKLAPPPAPRKADVGLVDPTGEDFSAFVFKIQANMNPAHRDRLAFIRICSGKLERGMTVYHTQGERTLKLSQPQQFMAQDRVLVDEAYPGDVVGILDGGFLGIGHTLCSEKNKLQYQDFPIFPPELFARVQPKDTMKRKQFVKGMTQLTQEGAVQVFRQPDSAIESFVIGTVGQLQFEVLEYRLKNEYGVTLLLDRLPHGVARWLHGESLNLDKFKGLESCMLVLDRQERPVILVSNEWALNWIIERNPDVEFLKVPADSRSFM